MIHDLAESQIYHHESSFFAKYVVGINFHVFGPHMSNVQIPGHSKKYWLVYRDSTEQGSAIPFLIIN